MKIPNEQEQTKKRGQAEIRRHIIEVLNNDASGLDVDSLNAVEALLDEIETRTVLLYLLKTRQAHGWVREDGKAVLCACDDKCRHQTRIPESV